MLAKSIQTVLFQFLLTIAFGNLSAQTVDMVGPSGSGAYGKIIKVCPNGNYIVIDPNYSANGIASVGAIYYYNGGTNTLISVLTGTTANDLVGFGGVVMLANENFVVMSPRWNNGTVINAGAVTWFSGSTGLNGNVNQNNSLVGSITNDYVGGSVTALSNGNYVICSTDWSNGTALHVGAATWGNGASGISGLININNSLIGTSASDNVGIQGVLSLNNGNYVVQSPYWNNYTGAITWGDGSKGIAGIVSGANSLIGSANGEFLGANFTVSLTNGNYVVPDSKWGGGAGAVTWCNGLTGRSGTASSANSLIGTDDSYGVGFNVYALKNGNYVIASPYWNYGEGAVTWANGSSELTGSVGITNSLLGSSGFGAAESDNVGGNGIVILANGDYVVGSPFWNNNKGGVSFGKADSPLTGFLGSNNSLVGSISGDKLGSYIIPLKNGNYVVNSPTWNGGFGATTLCNANGSTVGTINNGNSLIGSNVNDRIGSGISVALANGNYVVGSPNWNGNIGALTWGNGTTGIQGPIGISNSLVGTQAGDSVGYFTTALDNGKYVSRNFKWNNNTGAATLCNADGSTVGIINGSNSLIGHSLGDSLGYSGLSLNHGNYYVRSPNYNKGSGAITWGNGNGSSINVPTNCNTVFGVGINQSSIVAIYDSIYNYLLVGRPADNIVSRYYPALGAAIPSNNDNSTTTLSGNSPFIFPTTTGCGQIAGLTPSGSSPVSGSVTAKTWLESPQPANFVARHYEITPATNPTTSTGTITLYFTQADFDGFNNQSPAPPSLLPTGPNDAAGKSHLLIEKQGGTSSVGSGLPGTYPGPITTIDPADSNIVWNTALQRWEVTFDVTGFSGFFVKTQSAAVVLPLTLLNFSGSRQGNNNQLQWTTANEAGTKTYMVESSANGSIFSSIGDVAAKGGGNYSFTDINPIAGRTYYRLKMVDADGRFTYSNIIWVSANATNNVSVYPNPVLQTTTLDIGNNVGLIGTQAQLTDAGGKVIRLINIAHSQEQVDMTILPAGLYILKVKDGGTLKIIKQ